MLHWFNSVNNILYVIRIMKCAYNSTKIGRNLPENTSSNALSDRVMRSLNSVLRGKRLLLAESETCKIYEILWTFDFGYFVSEIALQTDLVKATTIKNDEDEKNVENETGGTLTLYDYTKSL